MARLLDPVVVGGKLPLRNRITMGSLTRNRCIDNLKPGPAQVRHYADRARHGAGLIVNEGTLIEWAGLDWPYTPVMIDDSHAEAWAKVTAAVHEEGGVIFFQAWHPGRAQNDNMPIMKEKGHPVLAPSAIVAEGGKYRNLPGIPGNATNITVIDDPQQVIETYRRAVTLAKKAGFDGVEVLAQGGYLIHQFLCSRSNSRTDNYGGSVENRCRFALELVDVISEVFGGYEFVCVKIAPADFLNDSVVTYEELKETYTYLIQELVKRKVGIVNICRRGTSIGTGAGNLTMVTSRPASFPLPEGYDPVLDFGPLVKSPGSSTLLMANHDYSVDEAAELVKEDKADMVTFARAFIYNPDLVTRVEKGIPLAENDRSAAVFYGPYTSPDEDYNDWPAAS